MDAETLQPLYMSYSKYPLTPIEALFYSHQVKDKSVLNVKGRRFRLSLDLINIIIMKIVDQVHLRVDLKLYQPKLQLSFREIVQ